MLLAGKRNDIAYLQFAQNFDDFFRTLMALGLIGLALFFCELTAQIDVIEQHIGSVIIIRDWWRQQAQQFIQLPA